MNPLLISGFGTSISVDRRRLIIDNKLSNLHLEFQPHQIAHDSIIIDGHTGTITFEALRWLMKHDINLILLNWNGNLLAVTLPSPPKTGKLRINQYLKYLDPKMRFNIAYKLINAKINHSINLIKELSRYHAAIDLELFNRLIKEQQDQFKINSLTKREDINKLINKLMVYEGRIANIYWDQLIKVFNKLYPDFNFKGRKNKSYSWNMNASDEVNALLNYGYAILESEIKKGINAVGLDPAIGFLHELAPSKTPLVYDIQELFRWIIDLSVIQLLEEKKLKKSNFIVTENYHIRLKENTAKMLIDKIKINFNRFTAYKGKNYSYQNILFDAVQRLANFILDRNPHLNFEIPSVKITRNDTIELKEKIMNMTSTERKARGINKSTLWYQKRRLAEGSTMKAYSKVRSKLA